MVAVSKEYKGNEREGDEERRKPKERGEGGLCQHFLSRGLHKRASEGRKEGEREVRRI